MMLDTNETEGVEGYLGSVGVLGTLGFETGGGVDGLRKMGGAPPSLRRWFMVGGGC